MSMKKRITRLGVICSISMVALIYGTAASAFALVNQQPANIIVNQQPVSTGDGFLSSVDAGALNADDFMSADNYRLDMLTWWGAYDGGVSTSDAFTVQLFADDNTGNPAVSPLFQFNSSSVTRQAVAGSDIFSYSLNVALDSIMLNAGSTYYLSVMNDTQDFDWFWLLSDSGSDNWYRSEFGEAWTSDPTGNFAMRIDGSVVRGVPEPESLSLFLLPLIYMAGAKLKARFSA